MHECPQCGQACYCDLDDSNDCREDGECFHNCDPADVDEDLPLGVEPPDDGPSETPDGKETR